MAEDKENYNPSFKQGEHNPPDKFNNQMLDHFRSIDQIVQEGSNPSAKSRFRSSSGRYPDKGD